MSSEPDPIRVLVCDDQALVRTGYSTIFSAQPDMEVVGEAANGHEAVAASRLLAPDVVVMDIRMPLSDGIQATRRLAGPDIKDTDPPKVLVVTTFNVDAYVYDALRAGASGFLLKDAPRQNWSTPSARSPAATPSSHPQSPVTSSATSPDTYAPPTTPGPVETMSSAH